jgi:uncharacterized protein involved in exopolysaccharide biosynthesis
MEIQNNQDYTPLPEDEIDMIALAKTFWNRRKLALKVLGVFTVVGLQVAL